MKDETASLWEQAEVRRFRELDRDEAQRRITEVLADLDRRQEALSADEQFDRWDLRFHLAIIETAGTADERELLFWHYLADLPAAVTEDESKRQQDRRTQDRLEARIRELSLSIGIMPAIGVPLGQLPPEHPFVRYRARLQQFFDTY